MCWLNWLDDPVLGVRRELELGSSSHQGDGLGSWRRLDVNVMVEGNQRAIIVLVSANLNVTHEQLAVHSHVWRHVPHLEVCALHNLHI